MGVQAIVYCVLWATLSAVLVDVAIARDNRCKTFDLDPDVSGNWGSKTVGYHYNDRDANIVNLAIHNDMHKITVCNYRNFNGKDQTVVVHTDTEDDMVAKDYCTETEYFGIGMETTKMTCPVHTVVNNIECKGAMCETMKLRCCKVEDKEAGAKAIGWKGTPYNKCNGALLGFVRKNGRKPTVNNMSCNKNELIAGIECKKVELPGKKCASSALCATYRNTPKLRDSCVIKRLQCVALDWSRNASVVNQDKAKQFVINAQWVQMCSGDYGGQCKFTASESVTSTSTKEWGKEVTSQWGISLEYGTKGTIGGGGMSASVTQKAGFHYTKTETETIKNLISKGTNYKSECSVTSMPTKVGGSCRNPTSWQFQLQSAEHKVTQCSFITTCLGLKPLCTPGCCGDANCQLCTNSSACHGNYTGPNETDGGTMVRCTLTAYGNVLVWSGMVLAVWSLPWL